MRTLKSHTGTLVGAVAIVAMAALFSINSLAASGASPQVFTGRLSSAKGRVTINFLPAVEGATFSSGSTIITEGDGEATVELGDLGRLQLRPNSNIKVMLSPSNVEVIMQYCSSITQTVPPEVAASVVPAVPTVMEIAVSRGEVVVDRDADNSKRGKARIKADKNKLLEVSRSVSVPEGDVIFTMNCCGCCFVEKRRP